MYIDKYTIKKIGSKYDSKKDKYIKNQTVFEAEGEEGMSAKCFLRFLEDLDDGIHHHTGSDCQVNIVFKEHENN
tara:strand:+ start:1085 stop:1306 length:222 start_codon:yes stop_codon:yes gene_type:complete